MAQCTEMVETAEVGGWDADIQGSIFRCKSEFYFKQFSM